MNEHLPANCPLFTEHMQERLAMVEEDISGNGLRAEIAGLKGVIANVQSDAFALHVGALIAEQVWRSMGKTMLKLAAGTLSVSGLAGLFAALKVVGII